MSPLPSIAHYIGKYVYIYIYTYIHIYDICAFFYIHLYHLIPCYFTIIIHPMICVFLKSFLIWDLATYPGLGWPSACWTSWGPWGEPGITRAVWYNTQKTMENHHVSWENSRTKWLFSIAMENHHLVREFSHETWWFVHSFLYVYQRLWCELVWNHAGPICWDRIHFVTVSYWWASDPVLWWFSAIWITRIGLRIG